MRFRIEKRCRIYGLYAVLKAHAFVILDSSMVEHSAVNRRVVGSSPTGGVFLFPVNVKFMGFFYA